MGNDFKTINDAILPFLDNDSLFKDRLLQIIFNYVDKLDNAMENDKDVPFTKDLFIFNIRAELMNFLIDVSTSLKNNDINAIDNVITNVNDVEYESRNKIIELYLSRINDSAESIKCKISPLWWKYKVDFEHRLNEILDFSISNVKDINEIVEILNKVIRELYSLEYDVNDLLNIGKDEQRIDGR